MIYVHLVTCWGCANFVKFIYIYIYIGQHYLVPGFQIGIWSPASNLHRGERAPEPSESRRTPGFPPLVVFLSLQFPFFFLFPDLGSWESLLFLFFFFFPTWVVGVVAGCLLQPDPKACKLVWFGTFICSLKGIFNTVLHNHLFIWIELWRVFFTIIHCSWARKS